MSETHETEMKASVSTKETFSRKNRVVVRCEVALTILAFISLFILTFLGAAIVLIATLVLLSQGVR